MKWQAPYNTGTLWGQAALTAPHAAGNRYGSRRGSPVGTGLFDIPAETANAVRPLLFHLTLTRFCILL